MRRVLPGLLLISALALSGCIWDHHERPVAGDVVLLAIDGGDDYSLCQRSGGGCETLVDGAVIALGVDERFISAARLPYDNLHRATPSEKDGVTIIEYYVVERSDQEGRHAVLGPFDDQEFRELAMSRNLPQLELP